MPRRNFMTNCTTLVIRAISVLTVAGLMLFLGGSEALAQKCKTVHGHFINQVFVPSGGNLPGGSICTAPSGLFCVSGRAIGGLQGDFVSTLTNVIPSQDTSVTAVVFLTADLVLHAR